MANIVRLIAVRHDCDFPELPDPPEEVTSYQASFKCPTCEAVWTAIKSADDYPEWVIHEASQSSNWHAQQRAAIIRLVVEVNP